MVYRHRRLTRIASSICSLAGHPVTFFVVGLLTLGWLVIWVLFKFDSNWLGAFSVISMIVSFVLLFVITHMQNRDGTALQIKVNELIRANKDAHNALLDLQALNDQDFNLIQEGYAEVAAIARQELRKGRKKSATAVMEVRSLEYLVNDRASILQDRKRLETLKRLRLVDTPPEEFLDRLTRLAQLTLGVPVALLSLVTDDRQFFKSQAGLAPPYSETRQTPASDSFCQHVVVSGKPFIVNDAHHNPIVCNNGAVRALNCIAYCGVPLVSEDEQRLGSFCAVDTEPRVWQKKELEILQELAAMAMSYIQQRVG